MKSVFSKIGFRFLSVIGFLISSSLAHAEPIKVPLISESLFSLGEGYQLGPALRTASCIESSRAATGAYLSEFHLDQPLSTSDMIATLVPHLGAIDQSWESNLVSKASLLGDHTKESKTVTVWYLVKVGGKKISLDRQGLKPSQDFSRYTADELYRRCGNSFVQEIEYGSFLTIQVTLNFDHQEHARAVERDSTFREVHLKQLIASLDSIKSQYSMKVNLVIRANQIGGKPERLLQLAQEDNSGSICQLEHLDRCEQILDRIYEYATNPNEFVADVKNLPINDSMESAAPIAITLLPYSEAHRSFKKLSELDAPTQELLNLRAYLYESVLKYKGQLKTVEEYLSLALPITELERLSLLRTNIQTNVKLSKSALNNCFQDLSECRRAEGGFRANKMVYQEEEITRVRSYVDYCLSTAVPVDVFRTVEAIKRRLTATNGCLAQQEELESLEKLDLRNEGLTHIELLAFAKNLQSLILSHNSISTLDAIKDMPHLKHLDVRNNLVTALDFHGWISLQKANFDNNQITSVTGLGASRLLELSVISNPIATNDEEKTSLLNHVNVLYATPTDVCHQERLRLAQAGKISDEFYLSMEAVNFIYENSEMDTMDNWVACRAGFKNIVRY